MAAAEAARHHETFVSSKDEDVARAVGEVAGTKKWEYPTGDQV